MSFTIGICGAGGFASVFIPLFQAHPQVTDVRIAEVLPQRRVEQARRFGLEHSYGSLEELCESDVDAIAIFSQRWMHGPQAVQALRAGKHVYSAVPAASTLSELTELVDTVEQTGLTYMMGETSYYRPAAIYGRERYVAGDLGRFVYAEGEYYHDMSHGFYEAYQHSGGENWQRTASYPPMLYPTHSIGQVLAVTGAHMTSVSCLGQVDEQDDGVFDAATSMWENILSNETALFRTSDGGMCRINEFRRVGCWGERLSLYGTRASLECQTDGAVWNGLDKTQTDLSELFACEGQSSLQGWEDVPEDLRPDYFSGVSKVHPVSRLPKEFAGLPNGHGGSHQFLVADFVDACIDGKIPPTNVWTAARYCVPGMIAHQSAQREGERLEVPDFGDPPDS